MSDHFQLWFLKCCYSIKEKAFWRIKNPSKGMIEINWLARAILNHWNNWNNWLIHFTWLASILNHSESQPTINDYANWNETKFVG